MFFEVGAYILFPILPLANPQDEHDLSQMSSVFFVGEGEQAIVMEGLIWWLTKEHLILLAARVYISL